MKRECYRAERVAQEILKKIAIIFHQEIRDPRVKMVTVSGVDISRDLSYARIFVTFLNTSNQENNMDIIKNNIKIINNDIAKYIRFLLSKRVRLRNIPKLIFFYDNSLLEGMRMSYLISNLVYNDKRCFIQHL